MLTSEEVLQVKILSLCYLLTVSVAKPKPLPRVLKSQTFSPFKIMESSAKFHCIYINTHVVPFLTVKGLYVVDVLKDDFKEELKCFR